MSDPYKVLQILPAADQEVIRAAFRALALKYHPDRDPSARAARRMIELNQAYALVRDAETRAQFDRSLRRITYDFNGAGGPPDVAAPARAEAAGTRLEAGRYAGWMLRDLADHDPDYLRWLSRHASGLRYRTEINRVLGAKGVPAA